MMKTLVGVLIAVPPPAVIAYFVGSAHGADRRCRDDDQDEWIGRVGESVARRTGHLDIEEYPITSSTEG